MSGNVGCGDNISATPPKAIIKPICLTNEIAPRFLAIAEPKKPPPAKNPAPRINAPVKNLVNPLPEPCITGLILNTFLSVKGESSDEIAGGVYVLRDKSKRVNIGNCVDTCGTGGDGMNTLNISTASALLLASMGIKVAKHGNKAVSSKCGSGDVLEALNININFEPKDI